MRDRSAAYWERCRWSYWQVRQKDAVHATGAGATVLMRAPGEYDASTRDKSHNIT